MQRSDPFGDGQPRGNVHRRAKPVSVALKGLTRVHANAQRREPGLATDLVNDREPQPNCRRGIGAVDHQRVAGALDFSRGIRRQQPTHHRDELDHDSPPPVGHGAPR
jgi:hypothetical protein